MPTTKIIVTHEGALRRKYGKNWTLVERAVRRLIAADAARGTASSVVALDRQTAHKAVTGQAKSFKLAIDHAFLAHNRPDYVLILGGPDIVPHQRLVNPLFDADGEDEDRNVPSDLPYACEAPYSRRIKDFLGPSRAVGRMPDLPKAKDPALLVALIDGAARARPRAAAGHTFFAVSCDEWKRSTTMSVRKMFGAAARPRLSPREGPTWPKGRLRALWHFINCHGAPADAQFYGQRGEDYPVAHHSPRLRRLVAPGTVVAAECCYGAELYDPRGGDAGIAVTYLREGAPGYVGSTTIAYGPADDMDCADLVCRYFLESVRARASLGRALLEARQKYIAGAAPLDPVALKTAAQFLLLGDPSLHIVATPATSHRTDARAAAVKSAQSHAETRGSLVSTGALLARGAEAVRPQSTRTAPSTAATLRAAAAQSGLAPSGPVRTFDVQPARDEVARGTVMRSAGRRPDALSDVRFHVMFAVTAPRDRPTSQSATRARGRNGSAAVRRAPTGVQQHAVIVAAERGDNVTVKRYYARVSSAQSSMTHRFEGLVVRKPFGTGTKSARQAVVLQTEEGELVLRREGGNAFRDAKLERLVGRRIRGTGYRTGYTLILQEWVDLDQGEKKAR